MAGGGTSWGGLSAMCSHIPNRGEQMVKYYGHYSNVSRGKRQKEGKDDAVPCILEPQGNEKAFRKSWARLIQKIGACPGEGRESRSTDLPEMSGHNENHQQYRGPVGDPVYTRTSGTLAGKVKDRRRKFMTRQWDMTESCPTTPLPIFSFKHTLILSTATPNTHGMNIFSHNA